MKPPRFDYYAPDTLAEALELRAALAGSASVLAGGQSLMPLLNMRRVEPAALIDIGRISSLAGIRSDNGTVVIGAMTRQRQAERSRLINDRYPLMVRALEHVASPAIRNRGTVGGSIAHAQQASELPAVALALDAELVAHSTAGERTIDAAAFFIGPGKTALEPTELLTEVRLPGLPARTGWAFAEVSPRRNGVATVGAACVLVFGEDGVIDDARLVFAGVAGTPVRARGAEEVLRGARAGPDAFTAAADLATAGLEPTSDIHAPASYRRRVAGVLARRGLAQAAARAGQEGDG